MGMGTTGTVTMTAKMMNDVISAVNEYSGKTTALAGELDSTIGGLIPGSFDGAAANGFKAFYNKTFTGDDGLNKGLENLLNVITQIAEETLKAIPGGEGLDDKLAEGNNQ